MIDLKMKKRSKNTAVDLEDMLDYEEMHEVTCLSDDSVIPEVKVAVHRKWGIIVVSFPSFSLPFPSLFPPFLPPFLLFPLKFQFTC